ncbi:Uncharacterised protein [Achromobacter insolitus]|uniref:glucosamine inositolphosphorylceramide transferase family protein n=1 Tax=Achromobacter insolitus TaxID=217204 RepID=UPI000972AE2F|nr:hypothetical protein [Achromobacter insolitus]APX75473.1 hypothetical protein BUW96_11695 [Achromobacter insolitus]OWT59637.1 hypothetical protein CEY08_16295 [Achromobacter insolitus]CAB3701573.1 hypothetical protein LMG6003_02625 [Achromobacter insolitus]VEG67312.1 Uncharacterised protein [Achromobacter insolitus]
MKTYRVGLLVDGYEQPGWMHEMAEWLTHSQDFEVAALLVMDAEGGENSPRLSTRALFGVLSRLEARLLPAKQRMSLACSDMRESVSTDTTTVLALAPGMPAPEAQNQVEALGLDLVIMLGASPATREQMAGWARLGVWQLSYSDIAVATSRYAGFWEVYQREDHTTVKLWRVGPKEDQDELLDQRSFNTEVFWLKNQARAFSLGNFMVYDALQALARVKQGVAPPGMQIMSGMRREDPVEWDSAAYIARQAWLMSDLIVRRVMKRNVRWRIGMFPSARQQAVVSEAMVLQPPKGRFFADPFVYTQDKKPYIFFEDYDFTSRKGTISVATYSDGAFRLLGTALNLPYHLSFPYIFEHDGVTYMVPETCGNRSIELWKCTEFPLKWELDVNLMTNISAVDTIIFKHGEYWWLLTNIDRTDGQSHCDELFAFFSDSPRSTEWTPHACNPIVRNPMRARNAGIVVSPSGEVIRCAQYQGFCHYGKGVSLNRIEELSPSTYVETDGEIHYASFLRKRHASMHHWHHQGGHTVFDFAYME